MDRDFRELLIEKHINTKKKKKKIDGVNVCMSG